MISNTVSSPLLVVGGSFDVSTTTASDGRITKSRVLPCSPWVIAMGGTHRPTKHTNVFPRRDRGEKWRRSVVDAATATTWAFARSPISSEDAPRCARKSETILPPLLPLSTRNRSCTGMLLANIFWSPPVVTFSRAHGVNEHRRGLHRVTSSHEPARWARNSSRTASPLMEEDI